MEPDLDALLADAVAEEASRARAQERMLRQAAEEGATFLGTLVELAERRDRVNVRTVAGRAHRGVIVAVGRDFIALREPAEPAAFVVVGAIASVRSTKAVRHDTSGERPAPVDASFAVVLAALAGTRPTVHAGLAGEDALLLGELRAVGRDVVTLRLAAASRPTLYVPLRAVEELVLLEV